MPPMRLQPQRIEAQSDRQSNGGVVHPLEAVAAAGVALCMESMLLRDQMVDSLRHMWSPGSSLLLLLQLDAALAASMEPPISSSLSKSSDSQQLGRPRSRRGEATGSCKAADPLQTLESLQPMSCSWATSLFAWLASGSGGGRAVSTGAGADSLAFHA